MKKWMAFFLALVMALSLWACDKNSDDKENPSEETKVTVKLFTQVVMTEENSDGETSNMKGVVEYDENYNIIGTKTYVDGKLNYEVTYDKDMNKPLLELSYDEDGQENDRTEYTYDEKGNCLERVNTYKYDDETVTVKYVSTYDADGNALTEKCYEDGQLSFEHRYIYTADGKLAREAYINQNGQEESWTENTYDEHGNLLSVTVDGMLSGSRETYENIYEGDKLVEVKIYEQGELFRHIKYDSNGNELLSVGYDEETGEEWSRTESTYENGEIVKKVEYYQGQEESVTIFTYNAEGQLMERSYTPTGLDTQRGVYTYGDNGELTGVKAFMGDEVISDYTLSYETVTVSKEVAKKIKETNALLATF